MKDVKFINSKGETFTLQTGLSNSEFGDFYNNLISIKASNPKRFDEGVEFCSVTGLLIEEYDW